MRKALSVVCIALLLPLQAFAAYSGNGGVWAMKAGDFVGRNFAGTRAGIQAAIDYVASSGGMVSVQPGTYTIDETIRVYSDGVTLQGAGTRNTIFNLSVADTALVFHNSTGSPQKLYGSWLRNLQVQVGANQSNGMIVQFYGGDWSWGIENLEILNPSSGYTVDIGLSMMNCQNGTVSNVVVRSNDNTNYFNIGVDIDVDDIFQRGNTDYRFLMVSNAQEGVVIARSNPATSVNNCTFISPKMVNSTNVDADDQIGFRLLNAANETVLINPHIEQFEIGVKDSLADAVQIIGGIFSRCSNAAGTDGAAVEINRAQGVLVTHPHFNLCYDGVVLTSLAQQCVFFEGKSQSMTNQVYVDGSTNGRKDNLAFLQDASGSNTYGYVGGRAVADTIRADKTLYVGGQAVEKILRGSAALNFDLTGATTHDLTITVTGAAAGDQVVLGIPDGAITTNVLWEAWVSSANTVKIRAWTPSVGPNPASGTFEVTVIK